MPIKSIRILGIFGLGGWATWGKRIEINVGSAEGRPNVGFNTFLLGSPAPKTKNTNNSDRIFGISVPASGLRSIGAAQGLGGPRPRPGRSSKADRSDPNSKQ
mgnify:CR=1 FL=1